MRTVKIYEPTPEFTRYAKVRSDFAAATVKEKLKKKQVECRPKGIRTVVKEAYLKYGLDAAIDEINNFNKKVGKNVYSKEMMLKWIKEDLKISHIPGIRNEETSIGEKDDGFDR